MTGAPPDPPLPATKPNSVSSPSSPLPPTISLSPERLLSPEGGSLSIDKPLDKGGSPSIDKAHAPPQSNIDAVLQALAWPAVSIIAILALFFIARQAITSGRNVEISWKVTEKITGRVVITKVRTRATKERATA
jgi:hypothetical protein